MSRFSCAVKIFVGTKSSCYTGEKIEQTTKGLQTNNVDKIFCANCWKSNKSKQFRPEHSSTVRRFSGVLGWFNDSHVKFAHRSTWKLFLMLQIYIQIITLMRELHWNLSLYILFEIFYSKVINITYNLTRKPWRRVKRKCNKGASRNWVRHL